MPDLLLELLSEEIPARMQGRAAEDLRRLVSEGLDQAGLKHDASRTFVTPRRLALAVRELPERQPDVTEEKKGPKVGAPEQALQGFMKANGLAAIEEAEVRESPKGSFYMMTKHIPGRTTAEVLPEVLITAITALVWPKSMRWGRFGARWVRPLHGILALFDGRPLSGSLDLGGDHALVFGDRTAGHRFLAPEPFAVSSCADYLAKLEAAKVMPDPAKRLERIRTQASDLAGAEGLTVKDDPGLLDEVTGLVEWPEVLMGHIDETFMDLPPEVLATAMRAHQKYFATRDRDGRLANRFLLVANMAAPEGSEIRRTIVAGNERVLSARLSDARFFWDQDRKTPLKDREAALEEIVFHAKLGTLAEKVSRMENLAVEIAPFVPGAEGDRVRSAAHLAKADLVTGMVGEFPELQGVMGRYYALHDGEDAAVAQAVAEHYAPLGPNDTCPSAPMSVAVALADKIDTLVGFWAIDEKPTGSKDPYALRRAALGVIRLIVENELRLPLSETFRRARSLHAKSAAGQPPSKDELVEDLIAFFADRLKAGLRDRGVRHDLVSAVFAVRRDDGAHEDDLVRLLARVEALRAFIESDDGANLLIAYRRAANIVRIESKKDKTGYDSPVDPALLEDAEERALFEALQAAQSAAATALKAEDFTAAMGAMAKLRRPVDAFFDTVMVNTESTKLRENRLRLLSAIDNTLSRVADFSLIEG